MLTPGTIGGNVLFVVLLLGNILMLAAFGILLHKSKYGRKLLIKFGLAEPVPAIDWTLFSWASCLEKLKLDVDVVFFGDSITRGASFEQAFPNKRICNLGLSGDSIIGMQARVGMVHSVNPDKIFLMAGVNDLSNYKGDLAVISARYEKLLDLLHEECPHAKIYIESILPVNASLQGGSISNSNIRKLNSLLKKLAEKHGHAYIDLYDLYAVNNRMPAELTRDGIHLHPEAYCRWEAAIAAYIE